MQNSFRDIVDIRRIECAAIKVHKILVIVCTSCECRFCATKVILAEFEKLRLLKVKHTEHYALFFMYK